mmetsp:Transcript_18936/g.44067  ORF Transcript_18936/g.44067 Transcript_18936/m.44067 type:complete len:223 (-) Transcript_18936:1327-1995(-)
MAMFQTDHHHLNALGHAWVAERVLQLIRTHSQQQQQMYSVLGEWLEGDICVNWFQTGQIIDPRIHFEGGRMNRFAPTKFAYEITTHANLTLEETILRSHHVETPLVWVFMTKGNPSLYPLLRVDSPGGEVEVVNPLNRRWSEDHVTSTQMVGKLPPKTQTMTATATAPGARFYYRLNMTNVEPQKEYPFRLVGIVLCFACVHLRYDLSKRCNQRGCVHNIDD